MISSALVLQQKEIEWYDCALTKSWHSMRLFKNLVAATTSLDNTNLFLFRQKVWENKVS